MYLQKTKRANQINKLQLIQIFIILIYKYTNRVETPSTLKYSISQDFFEELCKLPFKQHFIERGAIIFRVQSYNRAILRERSQVGTSFAVVRFDSDHIFRFPRESTKLRNTSKGSLFNKKKLCFGQITAAYKIRLGVPFQYQYTI